MERKAGSKKGTPGIGREETEVVAARAASKALHERRGWEKVALTLREYVGEEPYQRWFKQAKLEVIDENTCTLLVPTETHVLWIETNYVAELTRALSESLGIHTRPKVKASAEILQGGPRPVRRKRRSDGNGQQMNLIGGQRPAAEPAAAEIAFQKRIKSVGLNPAYTFGRFVIGGNSRFAAAACRAVAEGARDNYNPLFIHGESGLGKTHLMQAIGMEVLAKRPEARVVYLTCEKFTNEFIGSVQKGDLERFRKKYRNADLMLIDDVQFLSGKEKSQEEFFHTFNTLLDGQTNVVLTSDRPASEIQTLEPRLVSRFECGLTVPLQPPPLEVRMAILQRKMEDWNVRIPDQWVSFIAERVRTNVRRLEGAMVRIATFTSLGQGDLSTSRVEELLSDILREEATAKVTIDRIQKAVADYYDLRIADMSSRRRPAAIAFPRQVAMYLSRELTSCSLVEIGEAFGGRDHGTVIHACRKVKQVIQTDERVRQDVATLGSRLSR